MKTLMTMLGTNGSLSPALPGTTAGSLEAEALDFDRLDALAESRSGEFAGAEPFPHIAIDDFLRADVAAELLAEFTQTTEGWDYYHHYNEKKQAITNLGEMGPRVQALIEQLHSPRFVAFLERLTGVEGLIVDPDLDGAGLHKTLPGGHLNMHTDFLAHTSKRHWSRQLNLLIYFNQDWQPEWNGALDLWNADMSRCVSSYEPIFNRCVIFYTGEFSFHGHPRKLACPPGEERRSLALYYYRDEGRNLDLKPTHYRAVAGESTAKRLLVGVDDFLLHAYAVAKRYLGFRDGWVSKILKRF